jgi:hypothetical protein
MNIIKASLFSLSFILVNSCKENQEQSENSSEANIASLTATDLSEIRSHNSNDKIEVLNMGTFHFGYTVDANTTEFDEHNKENQKKAHAIAAKLATFKPTVIIVEWIPGYNDKLQEEYQNYVKNPEMKFENPAEEHLIAYEVGRLSGAKRIYGIDHKMEYEYNIGQHIENSIDTAWYNSYFQDPKKFHPSINVDMDNLELLDKLIIHNQDEYLNFLIAVNADMLTTAGTDNNFEGADEAAKFYKRNLRMFSNLNRINLSTDDRVFILMGAAHTAFFRNFMEHTPKFEMVNTLEYLQANELK